MEGLWDRLMTNQWRKDDKSWPIVTAAATAVTVTTALGLWSALPSSSSSSSLREADAASKQSLLVPHPVTRYVASLYSRCYVTILQLGRHCWKEKTKDVVDAHTVVTGLVYYPVKSLRRVEVQEATLGPRGGWIDDRAYMVVVPTGSSSVSHRFVSQRRYPILARIQARILLETDGPSQKKSLQLSLVEATKGSLTTSCTTVPLPPPSDAPIYTARVWSQTVRVQDMGDAAATCLQRIVEQDAEYDPETDPPVRLVHQLATDERRASGLHVPWVARTFLWHQTPKVSLADGFPLLMTSQASLDDLNQRLVAKGKAPLPMSRFRANLVLQGHTAWAEDRMKVIRVGASTIFYVVNGCPRCQQSCTDQDTGIVTDEPAVTLGEYRTMLASNPTNVYFGVNLVAAPGSEGATIRVGDPVTVLAWGTPAWSEG